VRALVVWSEASLRDRHRVYMECRMRTTSGSIIHVFSFTVVRARARAREFVNYALMRARAHVSTRAAGVNATRYARVPFGVCD